MSGLPKQMKNDLETDPMLTSLELDPIKSFPVEMGDISC